MTHKEYIKLLLDIREAKTESSEKLERLSKIYEIKPVSLLRQKSFWKAGWMFHRCMSCCPLS